MKATAAAFFMWFLISCNYIYAQHGAPAYPTSPQGHSGDVLYFDAPSYGTSGTYEWEEIPGAEYPTMPDDPNFVADMEQWQHTEMVVQEPVPQQDFAEYPIAQNPGEGDWCLPRIWASGEYVLWWTEGANVPPLVTTSVPGTTQLQAARLLLPTTSTLFGGEEINGGARSGARLSLGGWLDPYSMFGVEVTFLVLATEETRFTATDEFEILGRPFFNLLNAEQDAKLINFPGLVQGSINVEMRSEFYTGEALLRKRVAGWGVSQVDWFVGYRNARLVDDLNLVEQSTVLSGPVASTEFSLSDQFRTRNTFHGVDLGVQIATPVGPLTELELSGKVAVGTTRTEIDIIGASETTFGGSTALSEFGFLVQPTNAGSFTDDFLSTISEFSISGRRMFRPGLSLTLGYNLFFWHEVARAGDRIDLSINTSQLPPGTLLGEPRPAVRNVRSNFWAHGLRIGLEYVF